MSTYHDYIQSVLDSHDDASVKRTKLENFARHNYVYAGQVANALMHIDVIALRQQKRDKLKQQNADIRNGKHVLASAVTHGAYIHNARVSRPLRGAKL